MAVQTGEGTIEIIYGSSTIPAGARTLGGYLARPDGEGEWPTVLVLGPEPLPISSVKNICRVLARHGIAALAPDVTDDHHSNSIITNHVAAFMANPTGNWSNAQFGYGVLAFGAGVYDAAALAASDGKVVAMTSVSATIDGDVADDLSLADIPGLWIGSRSDDSVDVDGSVDAKGAIPQTTFVVHADAPEGFWNDGSEGFQDEVAADTLDRIVGFFTAELPPRV